LRYADLKLLVRTGLEHSFLPGASLWGDPDIFKRPVSGCSQETVAKEEPSPICAQFLHTSEKAVQQWELERRFKAFEASP